MAELITLVEMKKFENTREAVFPMGTIVTPSAIDWAHEHKIEILFGNQSNICNKSVGDLEYGNEKAEILKKLIAVAANNISKISGSGNIVREDVYSVVAQSLLKLGFSVEK